LRLTISHLQPLSFDGRWFSWWLVVVTQKLIGLQYL
jgi:hypothetical protein